MKKLVTLLLFFFFFLILVLVGSSKGDMEEEEKECAEKLADMSSCIPFVSGRRKTPTQECCDDTANLGASKPKCLCVLIIESKDPAMALPVNTTLALQIPSACNLDANLSHCPALLNLTPDSPDANIFPETNAGSTTPASSFPSSAPSASNPDKKAIPNNSNAYQLKIYLLFFLWMAYMLA